MSVRKILEQLWEEAHDGWDKTSIDDAEEALLELISHELIAPIQEHIRVLAEDTTAIRLFGWR